MPKFKAKDSFNVSGLGTFHARQEGEIENEETLKQLEARGLIERIGSKSEKGAPSNKMEAAPSNKEAATGLVSADQEASASSPAPAPSGTVSGLATETQKASPARRGRPASKK